MQENLRQVLESHSVLLEGYENYTHLQPQVLIIFYWDFM